MEQATWDNLETALQVFLNEWGMLINVGLGFATLLGLFAFGYALTLLIVNSDNPQKRQDAIARLWKAGITTGIIGGFSVFTGMFYTIFLN